MSLMNKYLQMTLPPGLPFVIKVSDQICLASEVTQNLWALLMAEQGSELGSVERLSHNPQIASPGSVAQ